MALIEEEPEHEEIQPKHEATAASTKGTDADAASDGFETASDADLDSDKEEIQPKHEATAASTKGTDADAASDGFETASDADLDSDKEESGDVQPRSGDPQAETPAPQPELPVVEPQTGPSEDDASVQEALAKSNEAKLEGNKLYGDGQFEEALSKYELALQLVPEMPSTVEIRSICYSNRGICFLRMGKYEETVKECKKALELNPTYVKALIRRAEAHEKLENFEEAIADRKKILELDPSNDQSRKIILRLEPLAAEKREKMKEEMIGKLKEMGNSVLGRFGMSIDNFKAVKDPNTGSYSIQFQK